MRVAFSRFGAFFRPKFTLSACIHRDNLQNQVQFRAIWGLLRAISRRFASNMCWFRCFSSLKSASSAQVGRRLQAFDSGVPDNRMRKKPDLPAVGLRCSIRVAYQAADVLQPPRWGQRKLAAEQVNYAVRSFSFPRHAARAHKGRASS
jgi:hypothetical protein